MGFGGERVAPDQQHGEHHLMPSRPIPFAAGLATDADPLTGAPSLSVNATVEPGPALRRRPGTTAWQTTTSNGNIIGAVVVNARGGVLYVTDDRYIWFYEYDTGIRHALSSASDANTQLAGTYRPQFVNTILATTVTSGTDASSTVGVVIIGGAAPQKVADVHASSARLGGSPPAGTHICELGERLIIPRTMDESGYYRFSGDENGNPGVGYYETWVATNTDPTLARHDKLVAGHEAGQELYLFGATTMQLHGIGTDALHPFETLNVLDTGMGAPYSAIRLDSGFAWMDEQRRFVRSDGRSVKVLSGGVQRAVGAIGTISDCWGFRRRQDSQDELVWVFPTEKIAYVYDLNGERWATWRGWSTDEYGALTWGAHAFWFERNLHLVAHTGGSGMCKLDPEATADLGTLIKAEVHMGADDAGVAERKRWTNDQYRVKRGVGTFGGTAQTFEVSHRDDRGPWSGWRRHSLGLEGDYNPTINDRTGGVSYLRERRLRWSGTDEWLLVGATAEFEVWA